MIETAIQKEKFLLVGVDTDDDADRAMASLRELAELIDTAGGECVDFILQRLPKRNTATYVGSGKVTEILERMEETGADGIVCDDELTPAQITNLREAGIAVVLDRTAVILDIFAKHALTSEGKLQVEMAQLKYRSSRLQGLGTSMSRLGGGIGTRGPGESKLETDRRRIRERISILDAEIRKMQKSREVARKQRSESALPVVAVVGYTNAGKSTLLNRLTDSKILAADQLFATLDPTTRNCRLPGGTEILMTDTVGFINKLPHHLVDAFRSTLEEAKYADILVHMVDASNDDCENQMKVVYETLDALGVGGKPVLTVFNKKDQMEDGRILKDLRADQTMFLSAKTGDGIDAFLETLEDAVNATRMLIEELVAYTDAGKIAWVRKFGTILTEEYREDGIYIRAWVERSLGEAFSQRNFH